MPGRREKREERAFEEQPLGRVYVLGYGPEGERFLRGDANGDGRADMTDAIRILAFLFLDGSAPPCAAALDVDRSLAVDLTDPVRILVNFFRGADLAPEPPYPECGRLFSLRDDLPCAATNCR